MDKNSGDNRFPTENTQEQHDAPLASPKQLNTLFRLAIRLIAVGVLLYVSLNHLDKIGEALMKLYQLLRPLLIGGLIALILNAPMGALERLLFFLSRKMGVRKVRKKVISFIALALTFLLAVLIIYLIGNTIIPQLISSTRNILQKAQTNIPAAIPKLMSLLDRMEGIGIDTSSLEEWVAGFNVNEVLNTVSENAMKILNTLTDSIGSIISGASSIISGTFTAFTAVIFSLYILANKKELSCQCKKLSYAYLKKSAAERLFEICSLTSKTFSNFISGQCLDALLLGSLCFVTMTIFRFPYALAISTLITVTAVIPYIGSFLGGAFGVLLMILDNPLQALLFVALFIVDQQIDNHLLYPRVVGGSVGLPAIWTFAAVIIGGSIWGVLGMVLFIPLFSVLYTLIRTNVGKRLEARGISAEALEAELREDALPVLSEPSSLPAEASEPAKAAPPLSERIKALRTSAAAWLSARLPEKKRDDTGDSEE